MLSSVLYRAAFKTEGGLFKSIIALMPADLDRVALMI
jgi:hypothetical protein